MSNENSSISKPRESPVLELPSGYPPFDFTLLFTSSSTRNELKAHRDTLSSKCEFFTAMFASGMADALVDHMPIDDFSPTTMSHFLHYLYHGALHESFSGECFVGLFKAGSFFGCPALCHLLLESVNDLCALCAAGESIFVTAWSEENIPDHFQSFVVQHLGSLTPEELTGLSQGALHVLVSLAAHGMCWAVTIFQFLELWACAKGLKSLPLSLVELVPFERMWATEFEKHVESSPVVPKEALPLLKSKVPLVSSKITLFSSCFFRSSCGPGQFNGPMGITVSAISGGPPSDVFVCDFGNHRVQVFSAMGVHKRSFGSKGSGPGQLSYPQGLSIDHVRHEVHVCDLENHRISVFAKSDGRHLFSYGSKGSGPGQLNEPTGVAVDSERGLVAVVDVGNPRVSVFKTSGEFVRFFGHSEEDSSDPKCQFVNGWDKYIALDPQSGHIVVSDDSTKRVQVMTWEGEWVGGFGPGLPVRRPQLKEVGEVAVGPQGQLFLCCRDSDGKSKVVCF